MLVDVVAPWQPLAIVAADQRPAGLREGAQALDDRPLHPDVLEARRGIPPLLAEQPGEPERDPVDAGHRHDVRRCPLQHRDVLRGPVALEHRRHHRDGGRAAADDDDLLAAVVEPLGPVLWVDDDAGEIVAPGELGREALVVAVVARRGEDPTGPDRGGAGSPRGGVGHLEGEGPLRVLGGPLRADHAMTEPDQRGEVVLGDRLAQVVQDERRIGDGVLVAPRLELVAEGVQVGVGPDSGVAEQVPRAADALAPFEDDDRLAGELAVEVCRRTDPGDPRTDDHDVELLDLVRDLSRHCHQLPYGPLVDESTVVKGALSRLRQRAHAWSVAGAWCTRDIEPEWVDSTVTPTDQRVAPTRSIPTAMLLSADEKKIDDLHYASGVNGLAREQMPEVDRRDELLQQQARVRAGRQLAPLDRPVHDDARGLQSHPPESRSILGEHRVVVRRGQGAYQGVTQRCIKVGRELHGEGHKVAAELPGIRDREVVLAVCQQRIEHDGFDRAPPTLDRGRMDVGATRDLADSELPQPDLGECFDRRAQDGVADPSRPSARSPLHLRRLEFTVLRHSHTVTLKHRSCLNGGSPLVC
ncbi:hypothetical protein BN12_30036 [Nostocoides japonicum T1-X7]|uniref:Uncharacterized protein n=1 Tax=Nostocoides japonicum T1-X7 TaxID=1194083 RepID=A0A077M2S5_9MICO|nr:hypothetical protein BN12_30036 [Tetrasphaera japonica T1-X7]